MPDCIPATLGLWVNVALWLEQTSIQTGELPDERLEKGPADDSSGLSSSEIAKQALGYSSGSVPPCESQGLLDISPSPPAAPEPTLGWVVLGHSPLEHVFVLRARILQVCTT